MPDKRLRFNLLKRKVRAYKDTVPVNGWRGDPRDSATENKPPYQGKGERCGKSTPAKLVTASAWKTPLRARLSRDDTVRNNKK